MKSKLQLSRAQLAAFLKDDDAIKAFERLFAVGARFEDPQYVDIDFPILIRTTGVGIPTLSTLNGNITAPQWQVNDFNVCESQETIHGWNQQTELEWHIHLTTNGLDATDRYVRFEIEYGYVSPDNAWVFPAVFTSPDLLIPANTTSKTMFIFDLTSFTPTAGLGGHIIARLKRVASVGAAPTANPWIPMLQAHVLTDTIGSRTTIAK
jgi:hypothetical protein